MDADASEIKKLLHLPDPEKQVMDIVKLYRTKQISYRSLWLVIRNIRDSNDFQQLNETQIAELAAEVYFLKSEERTKKTLFFLLMFFIFFCIFIVGAIYFFCEKLKFTAACDWIDCQVEKSRLKIQSTDIYYLDAQYFSLNRYSCPRYVAFYYSKFDLPITDGKILDKVKKTEIILNKIIKSRSFFKLA
jgi:hypothetical protein